MSWAAWWTLLLAVPGVFFLSVGTLGLLRLGDLHSRIHALTKADTLGLGLIVLALLPHAGSVGVAAKMLLTWGLALVSAAAIAHLMARGVEPRDLAEDGGPGAGADAEPADPGDRAGTSDRAGTGDRASTGDPTEGRT